MHESLASSLIIVGLPVVAIIVGIVIVLRGRRGKRIGDHPVCGKCGFDLFGRSAGNEVCPECGTSAMFWPEAVLTGHLQRNFRLIGAGAILILLASCWLGVVGWAAAQGVNLILYEPVSMLIHDGRSADPAVRTAAI